MKHIYHILNKCLLIILALQVLNMSFTNLNSFFESDRAYSASYNQIDCAFEYVTEHLLGWDNFIPENKSKADRQTTHLHKTITVFWYTEMAADAGASLNHPPGKSYPFALSSVVSGYKADINPPPPKA